MKLLDVLVGMPLQPHLHEGLDGEAQPCRVDDRGIPLDDSGLLELTDTAGARCMGEADSLGQLDHRAAAILLQLVEQSEIRLVQLHTKITKDCQLRSKDS